MELIDIMEKIRSFFKKKIIVNDWSYGGTAQFRGFRTYEEDKKINEKILPSQHSLGKACDFIVDGIDPAIVQEFIFYNFSSGGLGCGIDFTHFDIRKNKGIVKWNY